jgi:hypothetical protein
MKLTIEYRLVTRVQKMDDRTPRPRLYLCPQAIPKESKRAS